MISIISSMSLVIYDKTSSGFHSRPFQLSTCSVTQGIIQVKSDTLLLSMLIVIVLCSIQRNNILTSVLIRTK